MVKETLYLNNDEYYYEIVRSNIKKYRLESNLTQQDLADLSGVSRQYICDIENNKRNKHITIAVLGRIADTLNLHIAEFFIENDKLRLEVKQVIDVFYEREIEVVNS